MTGAALGLSYYSRNRTRVLERRRAHYQQNRERLILAAREHRANHYDPVKQAVLAKRKNGNPLFRARRAKHERELRTASPQVRIALNLRNRLNKALRARRGGVRVGSAVRDLGCSIGELKLHLEAQFLQGMSWNNYGQEGWSIDHNVPLAFFDLSNREQFLSASNYRNLSPMWSRENSRKGSRYIS